MCPNEVRKLAEQFKGKTKTGHEQFDSDGALFVPNLIDVDSMIRLPPERFEQRKYLRDGTYIICPPEMVVVGMETYQYPDYREKFFEVKRKLEEILGKRLYPTYYFDRFYFSGDKLFYHQDRQSCQISVSINIQQTEDCEWPFHIITPDDRKLEFITNPGDGVIYKGCECPHWRDSLVIQDDKCYHQIFMHYVLQDGHFVESAFDINQS